MGTEILLECRIVNQVGSVIENQVELVLFRAGASHVGDVQRVSVGRYQLAIRAMKILEVADRLGTERGATGFAMRRRRRSPVRLPGPPLVAQAFDIGVAVLTDDGGDAFRMRDGQP